MIILKVKKKTGFHPLSEKSLFGKTKEGRAEGVKLTPALAFLALIKVDMHF